MARIIKDKDVSKIAYRSQLLTADPVLAEWSSEVNNFTNADIVNVMQGTVLSDEFRIGDRHGFFYREDLGTANSDDNANIVVIKDFNPFMDTLVLHEPEEASFVWDQVLYPKDAANGDLIIAADKGSNELAAERYLSQPIKDSYGRDISHSYVIHELRDFDLRGSLLRINSIVEGEKQPELIVIIEGIDQDLLHFETSFNEGRIRMVDNDDESRQQLRFIVTNHGTDTDDHLQPSDAYTLPFDKSLLGEWLSTEFAELPERFGILTGGDGNDTLFGSTRLAPVPVVYLDGGTGNDVIYGSDVNSYTDRLLGQEGNDKLHGLRGENILSGGPGEDELYGGFNNDTLEGGPGADWLEAGSGFDTASYSEDQAAVVVNLSWRESPIVVLPAEGGDATLINPELTLNELNGDLREIAEDLVSSGYLRLDPKTSVSNFR